MEVNEPRLEKGFEYLDETHQSLIADATKFFSLAEEHSETEYDSQLHTHEMYMNDEQVEQRIGPHLEDTRESIQRMDAALTHVDEELENMEKEAKRSKNYAELAGMKAWYKAKYIQLTEELSRIEEISLAEKTGEWSHERIEYEKPEAKFEIEIGDRKKASSKR